MRWYRFCLLLIVAALMVASIACNFSRRTANLTPTAEAIPPQSFLPSSPDGGQILLVVDEEQLTALIAREIENQDNPPLQEPRIALKDGYMILTGKTQQGLLQADVELVMSISAGSLGGVDAELVSARVGSFSLPDRLLDELSMQMKSVFESKISPEIENVYIDTITIHDGEMIILGHAR